jgi:drug/metabolite transporter (DMT)-like permease
VLAAALALGAAALWGTGDFLGGLASRRVSVVAVLLWSQLAGLAGLAVWVAISGDDPPGGWRFLAGVGAGLAGATGLACLYRGMAIGAMGVVAPISATSPVVPLVVDLARGTTPGPVQWGGIVLALAGVVLLSREPSQGSRAPLAMGAGLALVAALGFGLFVVGLGEAAADSTAWAAAIARGTAVLGVALTAVGRRVRVGVPWRLLPLVLAVGAFDTSANALLAIATTKGELGIVAVLSALYPVTTVILAWALLHERLDTGRRVGATLALAGAALVAAG